MKIKPIDTEYKGYLFRSRLEARWAVFFDSLGISWQYEPEGYELADGVWYLPDFLILEPFKKYKLWIEIKPEHPSAQEVKKFEQLVVGTKQDGLIVWGMPFESNSMYFFDSESFCAGSGVITRLNERPQNFEIELIIDACRAEAKTQNFEENDYWDTGKMNKHIETKMKHAFTTSRSWRFERGRIGATA